MRQFFTVIGGMGTPATESYVRLLNQRTHAHSDQEYLNYILVNDATVPDRTDYILDHSKPSSSRIYSEDVRAQSLLQPEFIVIVCNTAHYFYDQLAAASSVPLLHMPRLAIRDMCERFPNEERIGLIATQGTIKDGIYSHEIENTGRKVILGDQALQDMVTELIYKYVKEKGEVNAELYHRILKRMHDDFQVNVIVLGCTELSFAQEKAGDHPYHVIDAQSIIVDKTIALGKAFRKSEAAGKALLNQMMVR